MEKLPEDRASKTRKFSIKYVDEAQAPIVCEKCEHVNVQAPQMRKLKFYLIAGMYPDGRLGEIFLRGDKIGGFMSGALDAIAMVISIGLQHGVPMTAITSKLRNQRFGPGGLGSTGDATFPSCTSMFDLVAQFLEFQFPDGKLRDATKKIIESSDALVEPPKGDL